MQLTFDMVPTAGLFILSESNLLLCPSQAQLRHLDTFFFFFQAFILFYFIFLKVY